MTKEKELRGLTGLLANKDSIANPAPPVPPAETPKPNAVMADEIQKDYKKVGITMYAKDYEKYLDFVYHMSKQELAFGHKEVQHEIMKLVEEKFGTIPSRPEIQKLKEQNFKKKLGNNYKK